MSDCGSKQEAEEQDVNCRNSQYRFFICIHCGSRCHYCQPAQIVLFAIVEKSMSIIQKILGTNKRTSLIRKNIFFSFLIKGWSALVTLLLVPLTLKCLGEYTNGVWLTIASMLLWIDTMDIGLGNGLRNNLATFVAKGDYESARKAVSTTFVMLALIIIPVMFILITLVKTCDVYAVLNVDPNLIPNLDNSLAVAIIFVCSTFIFKFIGNFYMGMQLLAVNNMFVVSAHTITLAATFILYLCGSSSLLLIAIVNTCAPLIVYLIAYPYTFFVKYPQMRPGISFFDKGMVRAIFSIGMQFFVLQICGAILFMTSSYLISKLFTPIYVTPYNISYRYFSIVLVAFTAISNPYWSATTDAVTRGDMEWIRSAKKRIEKLLMGLVCLMVVMILCSGIAFKLLGAGMVDVPFDMTLLMATYILVLIGSMSYSNFLNGLGVLKMQLYCTVGAAVAFIPLTLLFTHFRPQVTSILFAMILVNLPGLFVNRLQLAKHIKNNE